MKRTLGVVQRRRLIKKDIKTLSAKSLGLVLRGGSERKQTESMKGKAERTPPEEQIVDWHIETYQTFLILAQRLTEWCSSDKYMMPCQGLPPRTQAQVVFPAPIWSPIYPAQ